MTDVPKNSRRVLFFLSSVDAGGITSYSINSVDSLRRMGHAAEIVVYHDSTTPYSVKALSRIPERIGYRMVTFDSRNRRHRVARSICSQLALQSGDVLVGEGWRLLPQIVSHSAKDVIHAQVFHGAAACNMDNAAAVLPSCAAFICVSHWVKRHLQDHCRSIGVVAPPMIVAEPGIPLADDVSISLVSADSLRIAYVGRVTETEKQCSHLVRIMHALRDLPGTVELHILGDGNGTAELKQLAIQMGVHKALRFHGWKSHAALLQELPNYQVILSTSSSEGFATSLLECMAFGLVPVATAVGGAPDSIRDGVNGFLFAPGDLDHASQCIRQLADDRNLLHQMRLAARDEVVRRYTLDHHGVRLADALLGLSPMPYVQIARELRSSAVPILDQLPLPNSVVRLLRTTWRALKGKPADVAKNASRNLS